MTEYLVVCLTALVASGLSLFSGFGLGTILMPVFAIFFRLEVAIASAALVHLCNNLFKLVLLGRHADKGTVARFGIPAAFAALLGAWCLVRLADFQALYEYTLAGRTHFVTPVKLVVALLMVFFALFELVPSLEKISFRRKYLPLGGLLSGFFGGLSGHQGAMRSAFLIKCGLTKESFIATGVLIACLVDLTRILGYGPYLSRILDTGNTPLLGAAVLSAFLGAFIGNRLLKKVTMQAVQLLVSIMLFLIAAGLAAGLI